jgi:hypothetical protein
MSFSKQFRLFLKVLPVVAALIALKGLIHTLNLEFITINGLVPSLIAGSIFIIGFLLSQVLFDYKEAERMPGEFRVALEAIYDDVRVFAKAVPEAGLDDARKILTNIVTTLEACLTSRGHDCDMRPVLGEVDRLTDLFAELDEQGMSQRYLVRLKYEQDILRKLLFRTYYVQKMQFVPSVHVLVQTLVLASLVLLLFLRADSLLEPALIFGFVGYLFVYALFLIQSLEQPFRKGHGSVDDVSIFVLREFVAKISKV